MAWRKPRLPLAIQDERDRRQADPNLRLSPAGRYWPTATTYTAPTRPDGTLDVAGWCRDLDTWFNAGLEST